MRLSLPRCIRALLALPPLAGMADRWRLRVVDQRTIGDDWRLRCVRAS
jgi:diaminohydroxyphosphoribosylaminopyrimidine deaminase/5-amino-6-(5-phosphoribosylamino)uracil reductase